jgi:RND family efflux transporter MFP subunit
VIRFVLTIQKGYSMKKTTVRLAGFALILVILASGGFFWASSARHDDSKSKATEPAKQHASLTVVTATIQQVNWPQLLVANGNIAPWQETIIGSELGGVRLAEVLVNVGDVVHRGQLLASFENESVAADVAQQQAAVEEAQAALFEAASNAERARSLSSSGMISKQQTTKDLTSERSAEARLQSAKARLHSDQIRLTYTQILAPDDGVISTRSATVGAVAQQGMELFRLIRKGRLEWRADVTSTDLPKIKPGQSVAITGPNDTRVEGKVRMIAPTVDPATRNALVYVDIANPGQIHAGMFATGQFELGHSAALAVPQSSVVTRDGYNYVFQVAAENRVIQTRVVLGRRVDDRVEVVSGVTPAMLLVGQGAGFLADGDTVNVVSAPVSKTATAIVGKTASTAAGTP